MQSGYVNKKKYNRLSWIDKKRRIHSKLCFACDKSNCGARNNYRKLEGMGDEPSDHTKSWFLRGTTSARFWTLVQKLKRITVRKNLKITEKPENSKTREKSSDKSITVRNDSYNIKLCTTSAYRKRRKMLWQALLALQGGGVFSCESCQSSWQSFSRERIRRSGNIKRPCRQHEASKRKHYCKGRILRPYTCSYETVHAEPKHKNWWSNYYRTATHGELDSLR